MYYSIKIYWVCCFIILLSFEGFGMIDSTLVPLDTIYEKVEEMPRFPGCENTEGSIAEKKQCADKKMLEFIYTNFKVPIVAREGGVEGVLVIRFIIDEKGKVINPQILRNICAGCGKEGLRVVNRMNELPPWTPGKQNGKPVKVQWNLPIRICLE